MGHNTLASLFDGIDHCFGVPGQNCSQVNNFNTDANLFRANGRHSDLSKLHTVGNNRNVSALLHDFSLTERNLVVFKWNILLCDSVKNFGFKENARVIATNARQEHTFGLNG